MGQAFGCSCHQKADLISGRECPTEHGKPCPADPITEFRDGDETLDFIAELDTVDLRGVGLSDLRLPPSGRTPGAQYEIKVGSPWALGSVQRRLFEEMGADGSAAVPSDVSKAARKALVATLATPDKRVDSSDSSRLALELGLQTPEIGMRTPPGWQQGTPVRKLSAASCPLVPWQEVEQRLLIVLVLTGGRSAKATKRALPCQHVRRRLPAAAASAFATRRVLKKLAQRMLAPSYTAFNEDCNPEMRDYGMFKPSPVVLDMRKCHATSRSFSLRRQVRQLTLPQGGRFARKDSSALLKTGLLPRTRMSEHSGLCQLNLGQHAVVKAVMLQRFYDAVTAI